MHEFGKILLRIIPRMEPLNAEAIRTLESEEKMVFRMTMWLAERRARQ